jgi:dTDP-4-amino-4,6-dideoxygalactose transaminase
MNVPMYDHAGRYRSLKGELDAAIQRVLESGKPDWGPEVPAFEEHFAKFVGTKYAVATNSGMAALKVALLALGIGPGDEVITAPNSDIATTSAIHHVGARAVWVDVGPDTLNLNHELIEGAITAHTKAILPAHMYGHPADMVQILEIARKHNLFVIEDACLALGAMIEGKPVCRWGDIACISFAPTKHLGSFGSGGVCLTDNAELAERMSLYVGYGQPRSRVYGSSALKQGQHLVVEGLNERLDELQAAMLGVQLPQVPLWTQKRIENAGYYSLAFKDSSIQIPVIRSNCTHTFRNYVVRVDKRDEVQQQLTAAGIATALVYVPPLHLQPAYARLGFGPGSFPVTEEACDHLIGLPVGPHLVKEQLEYVVETLLKLTEDHK